MSIALDGVPAPGLMGALGIELALGAACAAMFLRTARGASADPSVMGEAA